MKVSWSSAFILTLGLAVFLGGCAPRPRVLPNQDLAPSTAHKPGLGSFNLQKRHGLGGWDKDTGPSESQLLKQMTVPVRVEGESR